MIIEELVEWVDEDEKLIKPIPISLANSDPKYLHREVAIIIVDSQQRILIQKRALAKHVAPGLWITTAAGHLTFGDSLLATAARELREEMGITVPKLHYLFREKASLPNENHFAHWYLGIYQGDPIVVGPGEVAEYTWLAKEDLDGFCNTHEVAERAVKVFQRYWAGEWDNLISS